MLSLLEAGEFLRARYGPRAGLPAVLGAGAWSVAYAFTLDGVEAVARFGRHGDDFAKDRIMAAHGSAQLPIPRVLDTAEAPGGFFAVSDRVRGTPMDRLDAAGMRAALPSLLIALDALAAVDVSARAGFGGWGAEGAASFSTWASAVVAFASDRLHGWRAKLEASAVGTRPLKIGYARLRELAYNLPDIKGVAHADLLHDNVFVDGAKISGLIDWGCSLYGDPLYDAAWLTFWWPWYPQWATIDIRAEIQRHWTERAQAPVDLDGRLRCYQLRIGLEHLGWYAWKDDPQNLDRCAQRVLELAKD